MKRNIKKISISLLIAMAFILPSAPFFAEPSAEIIDAVDISTTASPEIMKMKIFDPVERESQTLEKTSLDGSASPIAMDDDGCWDVAINDVMVGGTSITGAPVVMATGTYPISIEVCRPDFCVDTGWVNTINKDTTQEKLDPLGPRYLEPLVVKTKCTEDFVWIRFVNQGLNGPTNHERAIGMVKIKTKGDLGSKTLTTDLGDASGGTKMYHGATQIVGSTVSRSGGYMDPAPPGTNSVVTIKIPRAPDPASGKQYWAGCCDELEWYYYVWCSAGTAGLNENNAASEGGWQADFCDCDMYDAKIKKFVEVYKWHDGSTDPPETFNIFCEDFEDPCQVVDLWDTVDAGADGDTWVVSSARSVSPDHSYHNTQYAEYLPLAEDYLIFHNGSSGLDVSGLDEVVVSFQHWMEGDIVGTIIKDYGWVEYSFTGAFGGEEIFAGGQYYSNDWKEETFAIDLDPVLTFDDALYLRFGFIADPAFCYEGWYIDDVCFEGVTIGSTVDGYWEFVMDSHSWPQWLNTSCETYEFPDQWTVTEEGIYIVCAWLEALDPCHKSINLYPGFTAFNECYEIEIGDILELELDCASMSVTPGSPAFEGDDVEIEVDVCNIGTLDATNVQVKALVRRGSTAFLFGESFEGLSNNATTGEIEYQDKADLETEWFQSSASWFPLRSHARFTSYDASDGSQAVANFKEVGAPPWTYDNPYGNTSEWVCSPLYWTGADATSGLKMDLDVTYSLAEGEQLCIGVMDWDSGYLSWWTSAVYGDHTADTQAYSDWFTIYDYDISGIIESLVDDPTGDISDRFGICFFMRKDTADFDNFANPDTNWDGYMADNILVSSLQADPTPIFEETFQVSVLNVTDCATVNFTWHNAGVGQYLINLDILNTDAVDSNNHCMQGYNVINMYIPIDDSDVEFKDNTGGPSHWMVEGCCGGYLWCGDPVTTAYGNNWDDSLYLLNSTGSRTFDCTGLNPLLDFDIMMDCSVNDVLYVEYSDNDGMTWNVASVYGGQNPAYPNFNTETGIAMDSGVGTATMQFRFRFVSNATEVNRGVFLDNIHITGSDIFGPDDCTTMANFDATATQYGNWWQNPNVYEWYRTAFDLSTTQASWIKLRAVYLAAYGDYWGPGWDYLGPWPGIGAPNGWAGAQPYPWSVIFGRPDLPGMFAPSYGVYDSGWTGPRWDSWLGVDHSTGQNRPGVGIYPDNIDCSMIWTIPVPGAFFGWLDGCNYWDLENGWDYGYFEISTDNGANYAPISVDNYTGASRHFGDNIDFGIYKDPFYWECGPWDVTDSLIVPEIKIKWTQTSDGSNGQAYAGMGNMWFEFYGMADNNAPVTTIELVGDIDPIYNMYDDGVAVYLTATDDVSGVKATYYEVDGGTAQTYTGPFMVEGDGTHKVCYWSVDNEDNVEVKKCTAEFKIDQSGPSITISIADGPGLYLFGNLLLPSEKYIFLFGGVEVKATVSIDGAPLKTVGFYMNDELFGEDTSSPFKLKCTLKNQGSATFKVIAEDVLGRTDSDQQVVDTYIKLL